MRIRIRRDGNCSFVWTAVCPICPKHPFLIQGFGSRTGFKTHALAIEMTDRHLSSYYHRFRAKFLFPQDQFVQALFRELEYGHLESSPRTREEGHLITDGVTFRT